MLQALGLSYSPGPRVGNVFQDVTLSLNAGDKVALVGRNGSGKSLLLRILAGCLAPTAGRVVLGRGTCIGYLPQDFDHRFEGTLSELLDRNSSGASPHGTARSLHRLGLASDLLSHPYQTLSLGEKMRGAVASLLAAEPDILLLDEPTNHLDVRTRIWLEDFLRSCPEAVLLACHDRTVVNAVAKRVLELDRGGIQEYAGGFDDMAAAKLHRNERQHEAWTRHKNEDRRLRIAAEEAAQRAQKASAKPKGRTYDPKSKAF